MKSILVTIKEAGELPGLVVGCCFRSFVKASKGERETGVLMICCRREREGSFSSLFFGGDGPTEEFSKEAINPHSTFLILSSKRT